MKKTELAERMDRPVKTISELIHGKISILQATAFQLERVTGIESSFWMNADRVYQERAARLAEEGQMARWVEWSKGFPYEMMAGLGWVARVPKGVARVRALLRFFAVASPEAWNDVYLAPQVAYRKSAAFEAKDSHLCAWLRQGEIEGAQLECNPYDESRFKAALGDLRRVTPLALDVASRELVGKCREAGVAVVFVPELQKTHVSGATRWLTTDKALIQLSLRHKTDDHLWFTFFHEAAHILLHGRKEQFIESNGTWTVKEQEANDWAADFLIPQVEWRTFSGARSPSEVQIRSFAASLGIHPSIVVGRLQREKRISFTACNTLKRPVSLSSFKAS